MKKVGLLSLILITPLFMANSPMPYRGPEEYQDYELNNLVIESMEPHSTTRLCSIDITNTGTGYIDLSEARFNTGSSGFENDVRYSQEDLLIGPNQTINVKFTAYFDVTSENIRASLYGYSTEFEVKNAATFSNISALTKEVESNELWDGIPYNHYSYHFSCTYEKNTKEFGIHYAPILHYSDGEHDYYFHKEQLSTSYTIRTVLDLDETKLQLVDYTFIEGYEYYRIRGVNEVDVSIFMWVLLALFVFSVPVVIMIGGLVVLIIFIRKRKKNRGESQEPTSDNKENNS